MYVVFMVHTRNAWNMHTSRNCLLSKRISVLRFSLPFEKSTKMDTKAGHKTENRMKIVYICEMWSLISKRFEILLSKRFCTYFFIYSFLLFEFAHLLWCDLRYNITLRIWLVVWWEPMRTNRKKKAIARQGIWNKNEKSHSGNRFVSSSLNAFK